MRANILSYVKKSKAPILTVLVPIFQSSKSFQQDTLMFSFYFVSNHIDNPLTLLTIYHGIKSY